MTPLLSYHQSHKNSPNKNDYDGDDSRRDKSVNRQRKKKSRNSEPEGKTTELTEGLEEPAVAKTLTTSSTIRKPKPEIIRFSDEQFHDCFTRLKVDLNNELFDFLRDSVMEDVYQ